MGNLRDASLKMSQKAASLAGSESSKRCYVLSASVQNARHEIKIS